MLLPDSSSLLRSPELGSWPSGNGGRVLLVGEDETQGRNVSVQACHEKAVVIFF